MYTISNKIKIPKEKIALSQMFCNALILDAQSRQSLVTVRSLGSRGLRVAALETFNNVPAFSSRWCQQKIVCRAQEGSDEYLKHLEQILDHIDARVLIASSDATIALIRKYREQLEQHVCIALAKEPALGIAVNKVQTLEIARSLGLEVPKGMLVTTASEVKAALHETGLPAVVKPVESWVQNEQHGARFIPVLVTTIEEAHCAVEALTSLGGPVLLQQFLTGRREALSFLYARGQMYARFAQWARRTNPPLGGTSVLRQSIAIPPDIGAQAERLVREIDLEGYCEVEFRRDASGHPYLMEINPRLSASVEIAVRAGVDFPYLLYQWASGDRIDMVKDYRVGYWMRYLAGDCATTLASIRQYGRPGVAHPLQAILDFCTTFFVPMRYDYLDLQDPLPAWTAMLGFPRFLWLQKAKNFSPHKKP